MDTRGGTARGGLDWTPAPMASSFDDSTAAAAGGGGGGGGCDGGGGDACASDDDIMIEAMGASDGEGLDGGERQRWTEQEVWHARPRVQSLGFS